jgi:carboxylesterase type B
VGQEQYHCLHIVSSSNEAPWPHLTILSRFNVVPDGVPWTSGAVHFQEVAFVFYNTEGLGYPQNLNPNPLGGVERPKFLKVAQLMTRMWISFVNYGDPNQHLGGMR